MKILLCLTAILLLTTCTGSEATPTAASNPVWVDELIATMQGEPLGNRPQQIYRYKFGARLSITSRLSTGEVTSPLRRPVQHAVRRFRREDLRTR